MLAEVQTADFLGTLWVGLTDRRWTASPSDC